MGALLTMLTVLSLLLFVGCGSSETTKTVTSTAGAPVEQPLSGLKQFKACIERSGAKLLSDAPLPHEGRIAIGRAGNLPAAYAGAVVFPNGAYMDVWLASNARDAVSAAEKLNAAQSQAIGVTTKEAAFTNGRAVGAPGSMESFGQLTTHQTKSSEACLTATNE